MKLILGSLLAGTVLAASLPKPPIPKRLPTVRTQSVRSVVPNVVVLKLSCDYPAELLTEDVVIRFYHATNLAPPVTWTLESSVTNGTSTTVTVLPGQHYFTCTSYSVFWGSESPFSEAVSTPALPVRPSGLTISR